MTSTEERSLATAIAKGSSAQHHSVSQHDGTLSTTAVRREKFHTSDPISAAQFFATAYNPGWRLTEIEAGSEVTLRRSEIEPMSFDEVRIERHAEFTVRQGARIVVVQPRSGTVICRAVRGQHATSREPLLMSALGVPGELIVEAAAFDVLSIDLSVLRTVAAGLPVPLPTEIHFLDRRPRSAAATRAWHRTLDYVSAVLASADTADQPLIISATAQAVAATLLDCFASTLDRPSGVFAEPVPSLNRAIAFIHSNAMEDIGVHDIAESVHLTPRAVQYLFRRELDTTPTEYLRQVRLHRAHEDLVAGDRSVTVAAIAAKWGFTHTGRFAVLYRQTYGRSPHATLRNR